MPNSHVKPGSPPPTPIRRQDAQALAAGYTGAFRFVEIGAIAVFLVMAGFLIHRLAGFSATAWPLYLLAFAGGLVGADFVSGIVHWAGDTWGTVEWPVVGKALIRPFREHHVDQTAITRHDFVELNGANCLVSLPVLAATLMIPVDADRPGALFVVAAMTSLTLWVFATNQIHQWAHREPERVPRVVRGLQRARLILSPENHRVHHRAPYLEYFSITTGWCNEPLRRLRFYRVVERAIHAVTGAIPRQDDIGDAAAKATLD